MWGAREVGGRGGVGRGGLWVEPRWERDGWGLRWAWNVGGLPWGSPLVGEEFAVEGDDHAVAGRVGDALDVEAEVDRAHDAVTELLVDQLLDGRPVDLDDLVKPVDRRVGRNRGLEGAAGRLGLQGLLNGARGG